MRDAEVGPFDVQGHGVRLTFGGETIKMRVGRRVEYFEMHRYFGPMRTTKDGGGRDVWPERDQFWEKFRRWQNAGMKIADDGFAYVPDPNGEVLK